MAPGQQVDPTAQASARRGRSGRASPSRAREKSKAPLRAPLARAPCPRRCPVPDVGAARPHLASPVACFLLPSSFAAALQPPSSRARVPEPDGQRCRRFPERPLAVCCAGASCICGSPDAACWQLRSCAGRGVFVCEARRSLPLALHLWRAGATRLSVLLGCWRASAPTPLEVLARAPCLLLAVVHLQGGPLHKSCHVQSMYIPPQPGHGFPAFRCRLERL